MSFQKLRQNPEFRLLAEFCDYMQNVQGCSDIAAIVNYPELWTNEIERWQDGLPASHENRRLPCDVFSLPSR